MAKCLKRFDAEMGKVLVYFGLTGEIMGEGEVKAVINLSDCDMLNVLLGNGKKMMCWNGTDAMYCWGLA